MTSSLENQSRPAENVTNATVAQVASDRVTGNSESIDTEPTRAHDQLLQSDLETVLVAWQSATDRLQTTHELLRREIGRLSDELEAKNRELARQNRLADLGRMAAHVAHEVRNSLMPLTLYMSLLQRKVQGDDETTRVVSQIQAGFAGLETTVSDLLSFTSDRDPDRAQFSIRQLIDELLEALRPQLDAQGIDTEVEVPNELTFFADRQMMRRALLNLLINAVDAMADGGALTLQGRKSADLVALAVLDRGPGLNDEQAAKLFDPFYTTKSDGTGLGLAIVERLATVNGGRVDAGSRTDGGAVFTLRIPHSPDESQA